MMRIEKEILYDAFIGGAIEVMDNHVILNEINVFPVADSDTGSNLYNMMNYIVHNSELKASIKETLESISDTALIGARGNSGLIFAQYFYGISMLSDEQGELSVKDFVSATYRGFTHAYNAVEEPVEGTILTIMRVFYEALNSGLEEMSSFQQLLQHAYRCVENAVINTTEQLINLKKASVVDSGAKGFSYFIKGFIESLNVSNKDDISLRTANYKLNDEISFSKLTSHKLLHDIKYRYCTEALVKRSQVDAKDIRKELSKFGDSIVVSESKTNKRIHIHSNKPSDVFRFLSKSHKIISIKIDDMIWQYNVINNRKYKRVILTDSIADIPKDMLDSEQVSVINLDMLIGLENHLDKLSISNSDIFAWLEENDGEVNSSQPSLARIKKIFSFLMDNYEEMILITVSKALSGSYNMLLKASYEYGNRIKVVDSKQNSVGQGLIVLSAMDNLKSGKNTNLIIDELEKTIDKSKILVAIMSLDRMITSGRISSNMGNVAKKIKLKPIITLDKNGKGSIERVAFGRNKAMKKIIKHLHKVHCKHGISNYALTYVDDRELAEAFAKELEMSLGFPCKYIVESSSIIAAGAGKGAIAVAYTKK